MQAVAIKASGDLVAAVVACLLELLLADANDVVHQPAARSAGLGEDATAGLCGGRMVESLRAVGWAMCVEGGPGADDEEGGEVHGGELHQGTHFQAHDVCRTGEAAGQIRFAGLGATLSIIGIDLNELTVIRTCYIVRRRLPESLHVLHELDTYDRNKLTCRRNFGQLKIA